VFFNKSFPKSNRTLTWGIKSVAIFFYLVAVAAAMITAYWKLQSLEFHTRDYPFYAQFTAKLLNPNLSNQYALQPEGYNFLGLLGTEGIYSIHQSLHLEPIKYGYALIHQIFGGIMPVFGFVAAAYFLPILYLIFCHYVEKNVDRAFIFLITLLYLGYPSALETATYDLRPRLLLASFFAIAMIAVVYQRNLWEIILTFGFLLLTREEALVYGAVVIAFNYVRSSNKSKRLISTAALFIIWAIALIVTACYFNWTGYTPKPNVSPGDFIRLTPQIALLILTVGLPLGTILLIATRKWDRFPTWTQILTYGAVFVPLSVQTFSDVRRWLGRGHSYHEVLKRTLLSGQMNTYLIVPLWILLVVLWHAIPRHRLRAWFNFGLALLFVIFMCINLHYLPPLYEDYLQKAQEAEIVFATRAATNSIETHIITDYATYQAFYDYEHALTYNRLPTTLLMGELRYYPRNLETLKTLLANETEFLVITTASEKKLDPILTELAITPIERRVGGRYVVLKLR
jgi:hypothetical protein